MNKIKSSLQILLVVSFPACMAFAQQRPDAGELMQQQQSAPQMPRNYPGINIPSIFTRSVATGGPQVTLRSIDISGATLFSKESLISLLGDFKGTSYDLAGLRMLADRISEHYKLAGYSFVQVLIPQQTISEGHLRIEVIEGRFGKQLVFGEKALMKEAIPFLAPLKASEIIKDAPLERVALLLSELPGIQAKLEISESVEHGKGDLGLSVVRGAEFTGDVGFDNHGSRYTGEYRTRANLQWNSPFSFGDQLTSGVVVSDEGMWLGNLGYSLPLGTNGLRGSVGYSQTYYQLAKDFANLHASGTAQVSSVGLSYPLMRTQRGNLQLAASYQHKRLNDKQGLAGVDDNKSSDSLPIVLSFDRLDGLWGGGTTYGNITYTQGRLALGDALAAADGASGQNSNGNFRKLNLDISRQQNTSVGGLSLFGRVSAQFTDKNLDSSEGFALGGPSGVRAYPVGEATGDAGWLVQLEMRYAIGNLTPYVFFDTGSVTLNAANGSLNIPANPNMRSISGAGLGLRYNQGNWNLDGNMAWRSEGGTPQADTAERTPRVWLTLGYRF